MKKLKIQKKMASSSHNHPWHLFRCLTFLRVVPHIMYLAIRAGNELTQFSSIKFNWRLSFEINMPTPPKSCQKIITFAETCQFCNSYSDDLLRPGLVTCNNYFKFSAGDYDAGEVVWQDKWDGQWIQMEASLTLFFLD